MENQEATEAQRKEFQELSKELFGIYDNGNKDQLLHVGLKGVQQLTAKNSPNNVVSFMNNVAILQHRLNDSETSLKWYYKALNFCDQNKIEDAKSNTYLNMAALYFDLNQFEESIQLTNQANNIAVKFKNDRSIIRCLNNKSYLLYINKEFDQGIEVIEEAIQLCHNSNDEKDFDYASTLSTLYQEYGQLLQAINKTTEAKEAYLLSKKTIEQTPDWVDKYYQNTTLSKIYSGLAECALLENNFEEAKQIAEEGYQFNLENKTSNFQDYESAYILGRIYFKNEDYEKAIPYLTDAFLTNIQTIIDKSDIIIYLLQANLKLNNIEKANEYSDQLKNYWSQYIVEFKRIESEKYESRNRLKAVEDELKNKDLLLEEIKLINEDLEQFSRIAAHDLKEPIKTMASFIKILKGQSVNLNSEANESIDYIEKSADRILMLLNDLLLFSKITYSKMPYEFVNTDILVNQIVESLDDSIKRTNATITIEKLPFLNTIPGLFIILIQNLISNGIKFVPDGRDPQIKIFAEASDSEIAYFIKDNGIGIEEEDLEIIFNTFSRLNSASKFEGTGLGLATCSKIIKHLKGKIKVRSKINEGTTFIVTFPLNAGNNA